MKNRRYIKKKIISFLLCFVMILSCLPISTFAAEGSANPYYKRIADVNTMDNWKKYFDLNNLDTSNAGGVWTDKSVFTDALAFPDSVKMINDEENFLTALSALAANKEIVGYSTVPTDTVFVLDLSMSMTNSDVRDLVDATNDAIKKLQGENLNNRVGVVLYSGETSYTESVTRLLPIDRYTTTRNDGNFISYNNSTVSVYDGVSGTKNFTKTSRRTGDYTYIQAGLWEAWEMFNEVPQNEIIISDDNWQKGEYRMPIVVLMTDGAPTYGTSDFANVGDANMGSGYPYNLNVGDAFLVQLTASYVKNRIENKYMVKEEKGAGRSLFLTLGFNISASGNPNTVNDNNIAYSVVNPDGTEITDALWNTYNKENSLQITVTSGNRRTRELTVTKNSYATSKSYVTDYFSASGNGLTEAFNSIVEEIILQSRYYPTHLEGGSPDFSGYVEFEDKLGEYMEVKHINGILLGDTLFDGHMMASKLADTTANGLGTPDNPTELGDEFIGSVKTRLGITSTAKARALVRDAYNAGQLKYESATNWSNYIGWYAKADGTYAGFWDENSTTPAPTDAVYKNKSYGFLGETTGSIKNSDMMYMSVQVRTDIATGEQTLLWKIPASLVPMVTYLVTLDGTNVDKAENVNVSVENADNVSPIRLIFESGLRSDLNELNITRITDQKHIAADGVTRQFWTNYFDISASTHDKHITTLAEFTPSKENERFYYTSDSAVYKLVGEEYVVVKNNETLNSNGEYYHRRYIFKNTTEKKPIFLYEKMSVASINAAEWKADFKISATEEGAYVVPMGTPARELQMYDEQKSTTDGIDTKSAHMVFHPYLTEENNIFYVDMNLGNNGLLEVTPAQGLKLSKTVDIVEPGTSTDFSFRITVHNANGTPFTGNLNSWVTALDVVPLGEPTEVSLSASGTYTLNLSNEQTFWLTGIPTGAIYTIEEVSSNDDYKIKSVHVNGVSTGTMASGTVAAYFIDEVDFVNTAIGEGDLVITKRVVDDNGNIVDIKDDIKFTAQVTLTKQDGTPVSGQFKASNAAGYIDIPANGVFTVELSEGESFVLREIRAGTNYSVVELNIPVGFQFNADRSIMQGVIVATSNDQALIVNTYNPVGTNGGNITIDVTKAITGNRTHWLDGESYIFELKRDNTTPVSFTIDNTDADKKYSLNLANEDYLKAGTYRYTITELQGNAGGITYDTAERRFAVVVADSDMDGHLEVTAVNNEINTTVTKQDNNFSVTASFNNQYKPTGSATATINIQKEIEGGHALNGYQFALYDADPSTNTEANEVIKSALTDASGKTSIILNYPANSAGETFTYYLAEINRGQTINNIKYSEKVYKVEVKVKDNLNGTISAETIISGLAVGTTIPTFTNIYEPSDSDFVTISGKKKINGDRLLNEGEFEFVIASDNVNAPMPSEISVKNMINGSFSFAAIEFDDSHKNQTFVYTVTENNVNPIGGFNYDTTVYTITVTVTDYNQKIYTTTVINDGNANVDDILFENSYDPEDAEITLSGTKILTGKTLQDNEFKFVITPTGNTELPTGYVNTVENSGGTFSFPKLVFNKAGIYTYKITEIGFASTNYDFDESVYAVTVTVTDNSEGVLSASVEMTKNGISSSEIVFRNGFVPTPIEFDISAQFGGTKILDGRPIKDGEFEFKLINAINGEQIGDAVKNFIDGNENIFKFPKVTIPEAGKYHYKITEVIGDEKGVSYDTASYHIVLDVIQDENGVLHVNDDTATIDIVEGKQLYKGTVSKEEVGGVLTEVVHYENISQNGKIVFNNSYKADPVNVTIEARKTLTGRELKAEEFSFELYDEENNKIETVKNSADGSFKFTAIPINEAGVYVYTVREFKGSEKEITYDNTVYTVNVDVTDNLDGTFKVIYAYTNGTEIVDGVTFTNVYTAPTPEPDTNDGFEAPQTSDNNNMWLWFALMFVSGTGLVGTMLYGKKKESAEEN